ncbi:MAG: SUMF1/EgtB/PvdO family nonheme iron enzyme [Planctomycetes bacterium]|nr:SUMF1/EgtB/PvdO family nonheme iron enzyme [Planctomycetota bacterium]
MLRTPLAALAVAILLFGALGRPGLPQSPGPAPTPVDAKAKNLKNGRDDRSWPGMSLVEKGAYLAGTTMREAVEIEQYLRIGSRQKERFWRLIHPEIVDEKRRREEVDDFHLDRHECTNLQYHHFRQATGAAAPQHEPDVLTRWRGGRLPGATQHYFHDEVKRWPALVARIREGSTAARAPTPIGRIFALLDDSLKAALNSVADDAGEVGAELQDALIAALNRMVDRKDFYDEAFFRGISVPEAAKLVAKGLDQLEPAELQRFNRLFLDGALGNEVEKGQPPEAIYLPVTGITFFQAKACAEWMGKRLPTEMEWEKAARGTEDARWYPWGNEFRNEHTDHCNWALYWLSEYNRDLRPAALCPVGSFPKGVSPYGMLDMIGNALEFTADSWQPHPSAPPSRAGDFSPPPSDSLVVIKGGAYGEAYKEHLRVAFRFSCDKAIASEALGFRCAKDARVGVTPLNRLARDLFQPFWDPRLISMDLDNGVGCREKVTHDETHADHGIVRDHQWLGFVNIRDHLFESEGSLQMASEKLRRQKAGHIFLGVFHTDIAFTNPPLPPGNYAIVYQKGFKLAAEAEEKKVPEAAPQAENDGGDKEAKKPAPKKPDKKKPDPKKTNPKKTDKKKTDPKKTDKKDPKKPDQKDKDGEPAPEEAPTPEPATAARADVPVMAAIPRILFVDAGGKPVAAVDKFEVRTVRTADSAKLSFLAPSDTTEATVLLHLVMLKKYEKSRYLVVDIPIHTRRAKDLEGWRE